MNKLLFVTALCLIPASAFADEILTWRHVQHASIYQSVEVGNITGHTLNVYRMPGLATFPDGHVATTELAGSSDTANGGGGIQGYLVLHDKEGDLWLKWSGTVSSDGLRKGTFTAMGGTGRFAGTKGEGTFEGRGTGIGPNAMAYIDNKIILTK